MSEQVLDPNECFECGGDVGKCKGCPDFSPTEAEMHAAYEEEWKIRTKEARRHRWMAIRAMVGLLPGFIKETDYYSTGWRGFLFRMKTLVCLVIGRERSHHYRDVVVGCLEHGQLYAGWWSSELAVGRGWGHWYYDIYEDGDWSM